MKCAPTWYPTVATSKLVEIDGPVVHLRLQGACGSCPSSTMTLRMGIERRLREAIPEIAEVEQVM